MKYEVVPYTKKWDQRANQLLRDTYELNVCVHCGSPVLKGYSCKFCGSINPDGDKNEYVEFWRWAYAQQKEIG